MAKQPTTTPRWLQLATHGALIVTVLVGVISYGRSAGRTEAALKNYDNVPKIQSNVDSLTGQLDEIKKLIQQQGVDNAKALAEQNKRIDGLQQGQGDVARLRDQVTTMQSQMGTIFALAQSDSNKVSELKGTLNAILQQQKPKEK